MQKQRILRKWKGTEKRNKTKTNIYGQNEIQQKIASVVGTATRGTQFRRWRINVAATYQQQGNVSPLAKELGKECRNDRIPIEEVFKFSHSGNNA